MMSVNCSHTMHTVIKFVIFLSRSHNIFIFKHKITWGLKQSVNVFFLANSFVNPLVYTLRMKEFRKATRDWCGSASAASRSQMIEMNKVTG